MRVTVIGGGVIGRCTAYYALKKGHQVTVLERGPADHGGCSFGNAGMVTPSHIVPLAAPGMVALGLKMMANPESPFYIKPRLDWGLIQWGWKFWRAATAAHVARAAPCLRELSLASRTCFEELAEQSANAFGLERKGLLMLCKTEHGWEEEKRAAAQARALGIPAEVLGAQQASQLEPGVRMDIHGAVYYPKDCHLSPERFMAWLKQELQRAGAVFEWNTEVTGWRLSQNGCRIQKVRTTRGEFGTETEEFVICGGAWSPLIARSLGIGLPMQAGKGYSLTLPHPRQRPTMGAIFTEARLAVTPMGKALRFGGTMEIAGWDERINPHRVQGIIKSVPRYYPEFQAADFLSVPVWRGLRPCSPDGLPFVGRVPRLGNLSVATGHAMQGLSLGPITGKLMSQLVSGESPAIDIGLLNPARFD